MSRTILLADDSVTIQKVIELTFMDEDYEVVAVGNGDEALEKLDEITPDFVIADVHMPGADGYDVAKHSKSLRPEVPVLLLVSTFEPFDEEKARKSGCDAFLKKPFDSQELQQLVERLSAEAAGEATADEAPSWEPQAPEEPVSGSGAEAAEAEEPARAEPFSIGLDDEDDASPSRVSPPDEAPPEAPPEAPATRRAGFGEAGGATEAEPEVFELEPEELGAPETPSRPVTEAETGREAAPPAPPTGETQTEAPADTPPIRVESPLSDEDVDRIARRILELLGDKPVRDVAWEVVPDMAEVVIRGRIRELETQVESVE